MWTLLSFRSYKPFRASSFCVGLVWTVIIACGSASGLRATGNESRQAPVDKVAESEFVATALEPFWRAAEIREPIFFVEGAGSERPRGQLLFAPTEVLSVTSGMRDVEFQAGKDFIVDPANGTISLPTGSRIPITTREHLYPLMSSNLPKIARKSGDRKRGIFFDEGPTYHSLQVEVTYSYQPGQWHGPAPKYAADVLPKTVAKLRNKQPIKLVLCGDSISLGSNASKWIKAPPECPPFGELT